MDLRFSVTEIRGDDPAVIVYTAGLRGKPLGPFLPTQSPYAVAAGK
jgi:hypothetical protein